MAKGVQVLPIDDILSSWQQEIIRLITQQATQLGMPSYIVGGLVRDILMGVSSNDLDIVVEGDATALARALVHDYGCKATYHSKFKTATLDVTGRKLTENGSTNANLPHRSVTIDLISARSEKYEKPAILPTITLGSILDDLKRRDFTINALAIRLDGEDRGKLLDPLDGSGDLKNGEIRILHDNSFVDDPTRIYRAVRYEQRYQFNITEQTMNLIPAARKYIRELSSERIRHELDLILDEQTCSEILARLDELDLLSVIHPALGWDQAASARFRNLYLQEEADLNIDSIKNIRWIVWLLSSSEQDLIRLATSLQFDAGLKKSILAAARLWKTIPSIKDYKPSQWVEILEGLPLLAVFSVMLASNSEEIRPNLKTYKDQWRFVKPRTDGNKLKELGVIPGEKYHTILETLRTAWLDGKISTPEEEDKLLKSLIK